MFKKIDNASAFKLKRIAKPIETKQHKLFRKVFGQNKSLSTKQNL